MWPKPPTPTLNHTVSVDYLVGPRPLGQQTLRGLSGDLAEAEGRGQTSLWARLIPWCT